MKIGKIIELIIDTCMILWALLCIISGEGDSEHYGILVIVVGCGILRIVQIVKKRCS